MNEIARNVSKYAFISSVFAPKKLILFYVVLGNNLTALVRFARDCLMLVCLFIHLFR